MNRKKIKNPLIKRIPKEIIGDWKKYLVVFLFLVLTIGFVSGMYVANDSMLTSADEGVSKYKQEDGHFELKDKADSDFVLILWKRALNQTCKVDIPGLSVYTDCSVLFAVCIVVLSLVAIEILVERDRSFAAIAFFFIPGCFYLA